ncbi:MAG: PIN domain-containing protein [Candidatus Margulisbacteria bacterium]|jgi:predicted nucleic acid-binding protein|nr:PIN domain-containing protein [Candidatus Margulisiibacteriota bacterium]
MPNSVLIDAGPLIALFDKDDKYHKRIKKFISGQKYQFISTVAVVTEVAHMLDFNVNVQLDFLEWIKNNGLNLCAIQQEDIPRIIELTKKYADRPMDFADATLVIAAEKIGVKTIISLDADFDIYRLPGKVRIKNIFAG